MRYQRKMISCFLILCLLASAVYTDKRVMVSAKSNPIRVWLKIGSQTVSGKTISMKKGKKKHIKVSISTPGKKKYKSTFRSNRPRIVSVSKTGKLTAKRTGTAKITVTVKKRQLKTSTEGLEKHQPSQERQSRSCSAKDKIKIKRKTYRRWIKIRVVSAAGKKADHLPAESPIPSQTVTPPAPTPVMPSDTPAASPSGTPTAEPSDTPVASPSGTPTAEPSDTPAHSPIEGDDSGMEDVQGMYHIAIRINGEVFPAKLYQTETTELLMQKLPLSITMNELNGNEKYYYFSESFPTESKKVSQIHAGDLKLYGSSCLVLFYESFSTSYSYTDLGYVENPEGLTGALGTGNVSVEIVGSGP